jgi:hypothetical protein
MAWQARFHDEISRISTSFQAMRSELDTAEAMLSRGLADRRVPDVADLEGEAERQARVATLRDALEADLAKAIGAFGDAVRKRRQSFDGHAEPAGIKRVLGWTAKWSAPRPGQGRSGSDPLTDLLEVAQAFHTLLDKERAALITSRHRFEMGLLDMAGHRDDLLRGLMNEDLSKPEAVGRTEGLLRLLNGMTDHMNASVMTLNILRHKLLFDTGDLLAVHRALWQREPPLQGLAPYVVPASGRFAESALLAGGAGQARRVAQQAFADRFLPKEPDPGSPDDGSGAVRPVQTGSDRRWKMPQWPFVGFLRS